MIPKVLERERVVALRKKGLSYSEILKEVPVSKSSISLWLKESPLTDSEKKILSSRRNADISRWRLRAAASQRAKREVLNKVLFSESRAVFEKHKTDPFFQVGISLYWAEGAKRNSSFAFINSDPDMILLMLAWIRTFLAESEEEIRMRVFTHKAFAHEQHEQTWSRVTGVPIERFGKTIYKTQGLMVKKRPNYIGCVRIELGKVKYLRILAFWQQILIEHYKKER